MYVQKKNNETKIFSFSILFSQLKTQVTWCWLLWHSYITYFSMIVKSYPDGVTELAGELFKSLVFVLYVSFPRSDIDITLGKFPDEDSDNKSPLNRFRSSLSPPTSGPEGCLKTIINFNVHEILFTGEYLYLTSPLLPVCQLLVLTVFPLRVCIKQEAHGPHRSPE
jgi:hypothetical protein